MDTTSFYATTLSGEDAAPVMGDYLALVQARVFRRRCVTRFGLMALAAFMVTRVIPGLSAFAHWGPVAIFLAPPVWAWVTEIRLECRLSTRLAEAERKKVIKSS